MRRPEPDVAARDRAVASFPVHVRTPSRVRRFVKKALAATATAAVVDTVVLLASELATNAIVHARTPIGVAITTTAATIRVDVEDGTSTFPVLRYPDVFEAHGRGLGLVQALADDWGVELTATGKRVWFSLDR